MAASCSSHHIQDGGLEQCFSISSIWQSSWLSTHSSATQWLAARAMPAVYCTFTGPSSSHPCSRGGEVPHSRSWGAMGSSISRLPTSSSPSSRMATDTLSLTEPWRSAEAGSQTSVNRSPEFSTSASAPPQRLSLECTPWPSGAHASSAGAPGLASLQVSLSVCACREPAPPTVMPPRRQYATMDSASFSTGPSVCSVSRPILPVPPADASSGWPTAASQSPRTPEMMAVRLCPRGLLSSLEQPRLHSARIDGYSTCRMRSPSCKTKNRVTSTKSRWMSGRNSCRAARTVSVPPVPVGTSSGLSGANWAKKRLMSEPKGMYRKPMMKK
mmetsp:Transcript_70494/g.200087  ORF Transcript_70494/g.200087 Transcript_70494/m.200087 type:complete len:328 (-) Transcript_70494:1616-2599(-)